MRAKEFILEASYDGMITNLKATYPDQQQFIIDQLKWAKNIFKKDEKIVWWMRLVTGHLKGDPVDLQTIGTEISHFFGYNIQQISDYQFGKKHQNRY